MVRELAVWCGYIVVLTCPTVYPTPFLSVVCPWGTKYGSQCEFYCDAGSVRNGSKVVVCEKSGSGNYGFWTFGERQPHCEGTDLITNLLFSPSMIVLSLFKNNK